MPASLDTAGSAPCGVPRLFVVGFQPTSNSGFQDIVDSSNLLRTLGRDGLLFLRFCRGSFVSAFHYTLFLDGCGGRRGPRDISGGKGAPLPEKGGAPKSPSSGYAPPEWVCPPDAKEFLEIEFCPHACGLGGHENGRRPDTVGSRTRVAMT